MWLKINLSHFLVRHLNFGWVFSFVEFGLHPKTLLGRCVANQLNNYFIADQWSSSPIHTDMRKKSMLNLIPFARPRRKMARRNSETSFRCERLQFYFPQANPVSVASPTISANHQLLGIRIILLPHTQPQTPYIRYRKTRSIMISPNIYPPYIFTNIINSIGNNFRRIFACKVMYLHFLRCPFPLPFSSRILKIPHQFFLLRVHRYYPLPSLKKLFDLLVDIIKLSIPILVFATLQCLGVGLQTIIQIMKQIRNGNMTYLISLTNQFLRKLFGALAGPPQAAFGITSRNSFHQRFQFSQQIRMILLNFFSTSSGQTDHFRYLGILLYLLKGLINRYARNACCLGYFRNTTPSESFGLCHQKQSSLFLV